MERRFPLRHVRWIVVLSISNLAISPTSAGAHTASGTGCKITSSSFAGHANGGAYWDVVVKVTNTRSRKVSISARWGNYVSGNGYKYFTVTASVAAQSSVRRKLSVWSD